jgi:uncharacterized membrane protein YccC
MPKLDADAAVFALRCVAACLGAYAVALACGLAQPLWAAMSATMSATMVSQPKLAQTRSTFLGRVAATAVGALVSLAAGTLGARFGAPVAAQMGFAVALTALIAHVFPAMRPAIWTCPLVLLSGEASQALAEIALRRSVEVSLGALIGWLVHLGADKLRPKVERTTEV